MQGCTWLCVTTLLFFLSGCSNTPAQENKKETPAPPAILGEAFDETKTGSLQGVVTWEGALPHVPPFTVFGLPGDYPVDVRKDQPNPNLPRIQPSTMVMEDVIVFLRAVDLKKSRPWDHPKVTIEQKDRQLLIRQGETASKVGWVRAGETIDITNRDNHFHMLRGRGAAFFSLPFTDPKIVTSRLFDKTGVVELSSGAFFFWMHGYILVDTHPYYARTDAQGRFNLDTVPAGTYDLVCWMPNWEVAKRNRDPETGLIVQMDFLPPLEQVQKVVVQEGKQTEASFTFRAPSVSERSAPPTR